MRAKHRICRVFHIRIRIVFTIFHNLTLIMTRFVTTERKRHSSASFRKCRKFCTIPRHRCDRTNSLDGTHFTVIRLLSKGSVHLSDIAHNSSDLFHRHFHPKLIHRFQQTAFRLTQSLTHRPVCRLAEIPPFGMFEMCPSGDQRKFDIRDRRPSQHTGKFFFSQMCKNQSLPVQIQFVLAAFCHKLKAAAPWKRFHFKMHFRIMAQWFKMSHSNHRIFDGFPI